MSPRRAAFTLVEVLVALVITGLVTSVAYAALQGGIDTRERLEHHHDRTEAMTAARGMIASAVRHALPGVRGGPATFSVVRGMRSDSVHLLSRGIVEPYGTSASWSVTFWVRNDSLQLRASPSEGSAPLVTAAVAGATSLRLHTLARGSFATWSDRWEDPSVAPTAVRLTWTEASGRPVDQVVRIGLERTP
ncbi:MAG: type II secretion system protein [Gemmatimonadetes bacterium]|nr:type II secretion system protein [Gemmatimonadota bacterium]